MTGASWTGGGDVVKRTGKVLFSMGGGQWVCSATVIADPAGLPHRLLGRALGGALPL